LQRTYQQVPRESGKRTTQTHMVGIKVSEKSLLSYNPHEFIIFRLP
jgi:hypothetical protein